MVQSPSGTEAPIGVLIGAYSSSRQYYAGDEVTYNGSTYRAIQDVKGVTPTNTTYWMVIAQRGSDGYNGSDGRDGVDGRDGTDGLPGALPTTRQWVSGTTYVRNDKTVDYIMYRESPTATPEWWRLREGYTSVVAGSSPNTSYFEQISSFEAIATRLLLAEQANLAEFIFKQGQLVSQATTNDVPNIIMNGLTGMFQALNATLRGNMESVDSNGNKIIVDAANNSIRLVDMKGNVFAELFYTAPNTSNPTNADLYSSLTLRWNYFDSSGNMSTLGEAQYRTNEIRFIRNGQTYSFGPNGIRLASLPTSVSGLSSGSLYRDGNTVKIVL
jgi:hypothetical protein